ncbi:winged helix-turn-helix transcriptional regulator [Nocardia takedensis]
MAADMLSNRLQQLQTVGLIEKHGPKGAYELTAVGVGLSEALQPLWDWSESWEPGSTGGPWFRGESRSPIVTYVSSGARNSRRRNSRGAATGDHGAQWKR